MQKYIDALRRYMRKDYKDWYEGREYIEEF